VHKSVRQTIAMNDSEIASIDRLRHAAHWRYTGVVPEEPVAAPKSREVLLAVFRSINPIILRSGDVVRHVSGHASFQMICGATGNAMRAKAPW
jgi:hypothetical protein